MKFHFSLILFLSVLSVKAQYNRQYNELGIGADVAIPANSYMSKTYYAGIGGTVKLLVPLGINEALSLTAGLHNFIAKKNVASDIVLNGMVGYRYSFYLNDGSIYIEPKLGNTFISPKRNNFTYSGGIGHIFAEAWDLSLRYQSAITETKSDKLTFIGLNISYNFPL